jgi:hypothetical protein
MSERNLGEIPASPEVANSAPERKPYYPSIYLSQKKLGDIFDKLKVGESYMAEFSVKCCRKSENEDGNGDVSLELLSVEFEDMEEEVPKDMIAAVKAAAIKLMEGDA